jgi:hypothetical protein
MQKKCQDLVRDHNQMGKHDCYWRAKVRKTTWVPDRDLGLRLREFLPSIKNRAERRYIQLRDADLASLLMPSFDAGTRNAKLKTWKERHARA